MHGGEDLSLDHPNLDLNHLVEFGLLRDFRRTSAPRNYNDAKPVPPSSPPSVTNTQLQHQTNEQFALAVQEVEKKFMNVTASPVCQDLQTKVLECYQANGTEPLNCSGIVNAFASCVDRARVNTQLQHQTNEQFALAVQEVEKKFMNVTASPVCQDLQTKVLECYQANGTEPLNCSGIVNAFASCVDRARVGDEPDVSLSFISNIPIQHARRTLDFDL
ncbi:MICOS complex subunit [Elysia marginata]|uniref:MICOS complex subunit n=1 Tax=Elysia marginata TaxID=1093978 RepID=A0AAV4FHJ1_9GAST|nr:MICOS complex subunit [Elysia marginata]